MSSYRPRFLSVSAVQCYLDCPAAYHRRYVLGIKDPPSGPMAFGRAFATALEALHRGQDGEVAFVRAYHAQVTVPGLTGAASLTAGLLLLKRYQQRGVLVGEPEARFELYLPDRQAVPVKIVGYLDLLTEREVVEAKTTSTNGWDQGRADASLQAHVYRWAFTQLRGRRPDCVRFLVFHTRRGTLEELLSYPSGADLLQFELQAAAVWRGIVAGEYPQKCGRCAACKPQLASEPNPWPSLLP